MAAGATPHLRVETDYGQRTLEIAVEWGRYGEVYEYDYHTGRLKLPEQEPV